MITPAELALRHIPFSSLRSSTEAFIDYCLPQSTPKFNYALVGPGVSQNPNQPVNLREPHGFQVGGVSMPHGKSNPAHLHFTCEVFICTKGDWRIQWGFNPDPAHADIGEGDIASVPTWVYRGFTNIGVDDGFLFTALGGDHTGGVLWGPTTLDAARRQGVYLTRDHRIVDTTRGQPRPPDEELLQPMTPGEIAALRVWTVDEMARRIVRWRDLAWSSRALLDSVLPGCGAAVAPVIGLGMSEDHQAQPPVSNAHGVSLEWLRLPPGGSVSRHRLADKQVVIVRSGEVELRVQTSAGPVSHTLAGSPQGWDSFSVPAQHWRSWHNLRADQEAVLLVMGAGDHRNRIEWDPQVVQAAAAAGWTLDAQGCVAPLRFVDRAQR